MSAWDIVVIGGGIAGASAAWALAGKRRIVVLEGESRPGYHTTGRSAAVYIRTYGSTDVRALIVANGAIHCVSIGMDSELMKKLARENGGRYARR